MRPTGLTTMWRPAWGGPAWGVVAILSCLAFAAPAGAAATVSSGQAEAKEAARSANCTPAKVEVLKYVPGRLQQTVFKIGCNENKDSFVVVTCRGRACAVMF